jgi:hypothetical protein
VPEEAAGLLAPAECVTKANERLSLCKWKVQGEITMTDQRYASITEVSELIRQKKVSPVEIVRDALKSIEELNPKLNAFITILADQSLEAAQNAEAEIKNGQWKGPLHGIPIGVKDFFDTAGIKTTGAFAPFKNRVPTVDADVVTRLKNAGAIILGKMNMHELGMGTTSLVSYFGPVHNPWDHNYVAGALLAVQQRRSQQDCVLPRSIPMPLVPADCLHLVVGLLVSSQPLGSLARWVFLLVSQLMRKRPKPLPLSVILRSRVGRLKMQRSC